MIHFREDLLDLQFVSDDHRFGLIISRPPAVESELPRTFLVEAFRRAERVESSERPSSGDRIHSAQATFTAPSDPLSDFAPSRLGVLSLRLESDYADSVFLMFGGPGLTQKESPDAWTALRPQVPLHEVVVFPYYRGSYMSSMTGEDWGESYSEPGYWYSPQRQYRLGDAGHSEAPEAD